MRRLPLVCAVLATFGSGIDDVNAEVCQKQAFLRLGTYIHDGFETWSADGIYVALNGNEGSCPRCCSYQVKRHEVVQLQKGPGGSVAVDRQGFVIEYNFGFSDTGRDLQLSTQQIRCSVDGVEYAGPYNTQNKVSFHSAGTSINWKSGESFFSDETCANYVLFELTNLNGSGGPFKYKVRYVSPTTFSMEPESGNARIFKKQE